MRMIFSLINQSISDKMVYVLCILGCKNEYCSAAVVYYFFHTSINQLPITSLYLQFKSNSSLPFPYSFLYIRYTPFNDLKCLYIVV